ncbi:hypothetical protein [Proteiniphilum acetatigenes]|uniref:hypothetical protein n=1 Tax=Proteiniphilum acetatigenes TaxID=294710 RepID=UPI00036A5DBD|nr:hypothetical protein [Proteiniphilum acetatigenes]SFL39220.1 hypothetical protein SAMN05216357_12132 [Porphyromonadaceae bacterium KH3CP3RA]
METKINKLKEIDKTENPFKVPENYFAQFNEEIMNRLPEKEIVAPEPVSLWDRAKPWVYLAAMFVGLYITINFLMKAPGNDNLAENQVATQQTLSGLPGNTDNYWSTVQITEEEFYQYLEEQLIEDSYFDYMYHQYYLN